MLAHSGEIKVLDFGLAQLSEPELFGDGGSPPSALSGREITEPRMPIDAMVTDSTEEITRSLSQSATMAREVVASLRSPPEPAPGRDTLDGLSLQGQLAGTPLYMAPELWQGVSASRASDIYALGLVLYELLVGRLPHAHLRITELPRFVAQSELPLLAAILPDVPQGLKALLDRCVSRERLDRPRHVDIVRDELEALAAIYMPLGQGTHALGSSDAHISCVSASFLRVSRKGDHLAQVFYQHLFRLQPQLRTLFSEDLATQHRMLMAALKLCVENLRQTQRLVPFLLELGQRHARYGVQPEFLGVMGRALLDALASVDEQWGHEVEAAWSQAYEHIAKVIAQGIVKEQPGDSHRSAPRTRWEVPLVTSLTQWAPTDEGEVAFQRLGVAGTDLVVCGEWLTHVEQSMQFPAVASFYRQLASFCRVLLFDRRGCGMSSRPQQVSIDHATADIRAVMDAASADRAVLLGIGDGGIAAALFAALRPERVRALILFGNGRLLPDSDEGDSPEEALAKQLDAVASRWGLPLFVETLAPSLVHDPAFRRYWATLLRYAGSPSDAQRLLRLSAGSSIRPILAALQMPTLILHRQGDRHRLLADSQKLASLIPQARYVELPGDDHLIWAGGSDGVLDAIQRFIAAVPSEPRSGHYVGCVLSVAAQGGYIRPELRELAERLISKYRGLTTDAPADRAIIGYFDGPARALVCGLSIVRSALKHHLPAAAVIEVGVMSSTATLNSEAVQRAIQLSQAASPGETLATESVCELSAASGLQFVAHAPILERAQFDPGPLYEVRGASE
jgi:pimeloyl-ACP methyl ester carboxylesterase/hemoglobin-like flavoprotein